MAGNVATVAVLVPASCHRSPNCRSSVDAIIRGSRQGGGGAHLRWPPRPENPGRAHGAQRIGELDRGSRGNPDEPSGSLFGPAMAGVHERVRRNGRRSRLLHRVCQHLPACSPPPCRAQRCAARGTRPAVPAPGGLGFHRVGPRRRVGHARRGRGGRVLVSVHRRTLPEASPRGGSRLIRMHGAPPGAGDLLRRTTLRAVAAGRGSRHVHREGEPASDQAGGTPVFSAHQMSQAKLGADPQTSVANPQGELHDTAGVWIADASGMPTC